MTDTTLLELVRGDATPAIRDDLLVHAFDDASALAWGNHPNPVALDPAGHIVLQILDGQATVDELVADIHDIVAIPEAIARQRVEHTLRLGAAYGLLVGHGDDVMPGPAPVDIDFLLGPPNN